MEGMTKEEEREFEQTLKSSVAALQKIMKIVENLKKQGKEISQDRCPDDITLQMLRDMDGGGADAAVASKNSLWGGAYASLFPQNPWGFTLEKGKDGKNIEPVWWVDDGESGGAAKSYK